MSRNDFHDREEIRDESRRFTVQSIADRRGLHPDTVRKIINMRGFYARDRIVQPGKDHGKDIPKA